MPLKDSADDRRDIATLHSHMNAVTDFIGACASCQLRVSVMTQAAFVSGAADARLKSDRKVFIHCSAGFRYESHRVGV